MDSKQNLEVMTKKAIILNEMVETIIKIAVEMELDGFFLTWQMVGKTLNLPGHWHNNESEECKQHVM